MFKCNQNGSGFHMVFTNGWTVSVQWGPNNYADNFDRQYNETGLQSQVAEIAAWDSDHTWYDFGDDTVKGYVNPDEVAEFISMISRF